ncbi:hypothetical protein [Polycladomyces subterraneus]|uniref:DUF4064 domain-containing protein n=1 Tax=Polycladomyces subterraneus TaxID=1016997 RepID=A0ABT8IQ01_9BACL|nr:hypothetical protein [Polycladomyces subterraneus]MDN4594863.1 hypothetical protein [Polycladomyces subterraneus]
MNRTTEFVLALIGGIFGLLLSLSYVLVGGVGLVSGVEEAQQGGIVITVAGILLLIGSVASMILSAPSQIRKHHKWSGGVTLATGILGFFVTFILWLIPGVLLIISGALSLRSPKTDSQSRTEV